LEPWEYEALERLRGNRNALAANHFRNTGEAIEVVQRLYAAGAIEVKVGPVMDEPERVARDGGPYADMLVISFPLERRRRILSIAGSLLPEDADDLANQVYFDEKGLPAQRLWWDQRPLRPGRKGRLMPHDGSP
jgi:hypothetical protein